MRPSLQGKSCWNDNLVQKRRPVWPHVAIATCPLNKAQLEIFRNNRRDVGSAYVLEPAFNVHIEHPSTVTFDERQTSLLGGVSGCGATVGGSNLGAVGKFRSSIEVDVEVFVRLAAVSSFV